MARTLTRLCLLIGVLFLAACTIQINTTVAPSGAGELRTEMGFSPSDQEALSGLGTTPEAFCADQQAAENLGQDLPITLEERGDEVWCVVAVPFANLAELRDLYAGLGNVTINTLDFNGDNFVYNVQVEFANEEAEGLGTAALSYRWQVTMPGAVAAHNADEVDGRTLTWEVGLGETVTATATSAAGAGPILIAGAPGLGVIEWILIALALLFCCGLLVVVVAVVVVLLTRRRPAPPA